MNTVSSKVFTFFVISWALNSVYLQTAVAATETLTLREVELLSLSDEPGLKSLDAKTRSMQQRSVADGELMDPKIQVGLLNLPTDTFDFDQEPVTQLKFSYIQQFPSGNSRQIKSEKSIVQSKQFLHRSEDRRRMILKQVRLSFLEVLYWDQALKTVEKNRQLLNQLSEIVQSLFSLGRNPQLDVLTVQLQQSRLDDRLTQIEQKISQQRFNLSEWIGEPASKRPLSDQMPVLLSQGWFSQSADNSLQLLTTHPKVLDINTQLEITRKDIELTRESEKPGWNLNLSYSYRDDAPNGTDRADFVSAVVTLDVPLFTENRQNKIRQSQVSNMQSSKAQRDAVLRQMSSELSQLKINESLIEQRMLRYNNTLIPQAQQRAEAAMQSYQSGNGGFSSVMQAYIDVLNTELDAHRLRIDRLKNQAEAMYLVEDL